MHDNMFVNYHCFFFSGWMEHVLSELHLLSDSVESIKESLLQKGITSSIYELGIPVTSEEELMALGSRLREEGAFQAKMVSFIYM